MPTSRKRVVADRNGSRYHARITPRETPIGPCQEANSLTFETENGSWVGALPVHRWVSMDEFTDRQLLALLKEARLWSRS